MAKIKSVEFAVNDWTPNNTGDRIKAFRESTGRSQLDLAVFLGVTPTTISRWENGHHVPDFRTRRTIQAVVEGM
jgi:transcriptional regulator with XRE-family HTH domain